MRWIDPGNSRCKPGNKARTERATATAFAPACRETAKTMTEAGGLNPRDEKMPREPLVLDAVDDAGHVAEINRRAIAPCLTIMLR